MARIAYECGEEPSQVPKDSNRDSLLLLLTEKFCHIAQKDFAWREKEFRRRSAERQLALAPF